MPDTISRTLELKTCQSCGETFGCGAKLDGCWCVGVELPTDAAVQLNAKYLDCLCPKCLQSMAAVFEENEKSVT